MLMSDSKQRKKALFEAVSRLRKSSGSMMDDSYFEHIRVGGDLSNETERFDYAGMLAPEYTYSDGRLYFRTEEKDIFIANGFPVAKRLIERVNPGGTKSSIIAFSYVIEGTECEEMHEIETDRLKNFDFETPFRLIVSPTCSNARKHFENILKKTSKGIEVDKKLRFSKLGWTDAPCGHVYVAGKTVVTSDGKMDAGQFSLDNSISGILMDVDEARPVDRLLRILLKRLAGYPQATLVFFYAVASMLKSLFFKAGVMNWFALLLVGKSEVGKTSTAEYWANIFKRHAGGPSAVVGLDSSQPYAHYATDLFRDSTLILDDMNKTLSPETKRKKERIFGEIIQGVFNSYAHSDMQKSKSFEGGLIATGEYILDNISTLNRTLLVDMKKRIIEKDEFDRLSADQRFMPTVFYHFLVWAAANHDFLVDSIKNIIAKKRQISSHCRINDTASILTAAGLIFCIFCRSMMDEDVDLTTNVFRTFSKSLEEACARQDSHIRKIEKNNTEIDFAVVLYNLYASGRLDVGKKSLEKHDFVVNNGHLIVTTDTLNTIMRKNLNGVKLKPRAVSTQLGDNGLLDTDKSAQPKSTKKYYKIRALHINVARLQEYYMENRDNLPKNMLQGDAASTSLSSIWHTDDNPA